MKKNLHSLAAMVCIAVALQISYCHGQKKAPTYKPVRTVEPSIKKPYDSTRYKKDQIIVIYKGKPDPASLAKLKEKIHGAQFDASQIKTTRQCRSCNGYIELWEAPEIETRIHADGLIAGAKSPKPNPVGEDELAYYLLNFKQEIPMDPMDINFQTFKFDSLNKVVNNKSGKKIIRVAVLDTGIDTKQVINPSYLWTNPEVDDEKNCYIGDRSGWNFIRDNSNLHDDDPNLHGTLVSQYIINEFAASTINAVEIMPLKTFDKKGNGDLFSAICAIHYAMENGANIINASWGFYYFDGDPHPYLKKLITRELRDKGILFVAAAGNKTVESDKAAKKAYMDEYGIDIPDGLLRDLECHNFYPACLSQEDNNVITATTADKNNVSPTQNYSNVYVDLGAFPDHVNANTMRFRVPFPGPDPFVSGSSFAAAIVTGRIGATLRHTSYASGLDKRVLLPQIDTSPLGTRSSVLEPEHIRLGRLTQHH